MAIRIGGKNPYIPQVERPSNVADNPEQNPQNPEGQAEQGEQGRKQEKPIPPEEAVELLAKQAEAGRQALEKLNKLRGIEQGSHTPPVVKKEPPSVEEFAQAGTTDEGEPKPGKNNSDLIAQLRKGMFKGRFRG